jgi:hypothetical protein
MVVPRVLFPPEPGEVEGKESQKPLSGSPAFPLPSFITNLPIIDAPEAPPGLPGFISNCKDLASSHRVARQAGPAAAKKTRKARPRKTAKAKATAKAKSKAKPGAAALPSTGSAAVALILGCRRCRGGDNGCATSGPTKGCRDPSFMGERGPQTKQQKAA